ncbi:TonB-dependent receptor [Pseudoxanthomonas mexicana]
MKQRNRTTFRPNRRLLSCALASCLAMAAPQVMAQSTGATLRGSASTDATITVTNVETGLTRSANAANGSYSIGGLPPGTYRIELSSGGQTSRRDVTLAVGQTATLNLESAAATTLDTVTVTAPMMVVETKTSEVATYVSQTQMELLPQNSRNFLAFADLVPGMAFTTSNNGESQLRSGAQGANNINVYIDGVGQKNYVTPGGLTGQDDSRGNPFPQLAIGEYKVITSNYKAEYDQISSAAVTAVTKSGTNEFSGSFYWDRTSHDWRKPTPAEERLGKASDVTEQYGMAFGGPIIKDKLHFFVTYEAKDFKVPQLVEAPANVRNAYTLPSEITQFYGPATQPFNQKVYFGKLSWLANESNLFELTAKYRDETGVLDVGNDRRIGSAGTAMVNDETRIDLRHQFTSTNWLNDAHITYEESAYNPSPLTASPGIRHTVITPNQSNSTNNTVVLWTGSGPNGQDKGQKGWAVQDDLTYFGWGDHTLKMGVKYKQVDLNAFQFFPPFPQYFFDIFDTVDQPYQLQYGAVRPGRNPYVVSENKQFGVYIQDDWQATDKLTLNLGVRWDYEDNPSFEDHVLNADIASALRAWPNIQNTDYNINDYISNGNNRSNFKDAIQPRLGFSYDLFGDQRHVIFGGAGRAYDRNIFDYMAREFYSGATTTVTLGFQTPLHPCLNPNGSVLRACVPFDPALMTPEGIAAYAAANPQGTQSEVFLINNDLKTPYSDQFSLGMRNIFAMFGHDWNSSVAISHIRSYDGIYFHNGRRRPDGSFHQFEAQGQTFGNGPGDNVPGVGGVLLGDNGFEYRSTSLLVSLDKPYTDASKWGVNVAYTFTDGEENRPNASNNETFLFDYAWAGNEFYDSTGVAKHRLVLSGIYSPGWDLIFSGKLIVSTPIPLQSVNRLNSPANGTCAPITGVANCGDLRAYYDPVTPDGTLGFKQLDLAVEKRWSTGTDLSFKVRADLINALDWNNWTSFDTNRGPAGGPANPNVGRRNGDAVLLPTRTFKVSFGFDW